MVCQRGEKELATQQQTAATQEFEALLAALLTSRVPRVAVYDKLVTYKKKTFGGSQAIETFALHGEGWEIGRFTWSFSGSGPHGGSDEKRPWPTVLLDRHTDFTQQENLVRVEYDLRRGGFIRMPGLLGYCSPGALTKAIAEQLEKYGR